jgi:hypothetical protein
VPGLASGLVVYDGVALTGTLLQYDYMCLQGDHGRPGAANRQGAGAWPGPHHGGALNILQGTHFPLMFLQGDH